MIRFTPFCNALVLFFLLAGIFLITFPFLQGEGNYETLTEKNIVISSFHTVSYGNSSHIIKDSDGFRYFVCGEYDYKKLKDTLRPGLTVQIKTWRGKFIPFRYIEELSVGGEQLVSYLDIWKENQKGSVGCGIFCLLIGGLLIGFQYLNFQSEKKKLEKRQKQIEKKYGNQNFENEPSNKTKK